MRRPLLPLVPREVGDPPLEALRLVTPLGDEVAPFAGVVRKIEQSAAFRVVAVVNELPVSLDARPQAGSPQQLGGDQR